jgi:tetratricopeptide (TPR) repeat protein
MAPFRIVKFIAFIFFMFISLSLPAWAQSSSAGEADDVSRGIGLYRKGDYKGAIEVLRAAIKKRENVEAWHYLARAQMRSGDLKASRISFEKAINLRPDHAASHSGLAYLLLISDDPKNAEKVAEKALSIDSQDGDAHYVLAKVYSLEKRWDAALQESEAALKSAPESGEPLLVKAQSLVGQIGSRGSSRARGGDGETEVRNRSLSTAGQRLKLEAAQEALGNYLRLLPDTKDAIWWREQLEAIKGHVKLLKDREEEKRNPTDVQADVKGSATRPFILYKEKANRTRESRDRGISGTVKLRAIFAADGSVKDILVIEGLEAGLSWKAVEAARAIRFKPATKGGQPVPVLSYLEFTFSLY